jgi:predicted acyl esterase
MGRTPLLGRLLVSLVAGAVAAVLPSVTTAPPASAAGGWRARPATYGVDVTQDVPVTMSDGTVLRVNVYRPADADGTPVNRRFPVILTQTPYNPPPRPC